jgi:hypothetical protein
VDGAPLGAPVGFTRLPSGASRGLLYVGSDTVDVDGSYWAGAVDDVCVFDVPLTDAEVASVFADGGCAAWADGGDAVDTGRAPRGPGDDDGKGCGCDALVGAGGAWWAAAVVAGWLRRGRRPTTYRTT